MSTATDFDIAISEIDSEKEPDKLVGIIKQWYERDTAQRFLRASVWSQNIHFLAGDQWLRWNNAERRWTSIPWTAANGTIDRPVANYILVYVNSNLSAFTQQPVMVISPNSDDPRDKTMAGVAEVVKDYLWEKLKKDFQYDEAAMWGLTCSVAFRKSCKVPYGAPMQVPIPQDHPMYAEQVAKQGSPEPVKPVMRKKVYSEIVSPFNITYDGLAKRLEDTSIIMETQIRRLEWIKKHYGQAGEGYTGNADKVPEDVKLTNFLSVGEALKDIVEGANQTGYARSVADIKNSNIVHEVYIRPTENHPKGRMVVIAGDYLLYDSALGGDKGSPYFYNEGDYWHPYTWWLYFPLPGAPIGISLVQQLVPKQRSINSIDALIAYNRKTVGVGQWLIPTTSNVPDESIVGKPGQQISYTPGPRGEKPERIQGTPLPMQVLEERQMHLADMDRIANSADVRTGQNPKGVTTVGQLMILNENARQAMSKPVERWEKFLERSEALDLKNFQSCLTNVQDPEIIAELKKLSKDLSGVDWDTFTFETLQDNVNVRVEKGSTMAKSKVVMQQMILDLAKSGLLPEVVGDPFAHKLLLEKFGLTELLSESSMDVKKAEKCIELMLGGIYPPVEDYDNPDIQLLVLVRFMKSPKFMDLDPTTVLLFKRRFDEYVQKLAMANAVPDNTPEPGPTGPQPSAGGGGSKKPVSGKPNPKKPLGDATQSPTA